MTPTPDLLREFITGQILMDPAYALADEDELLASGLLDSMAVMRLVFFIEESLGIKVPYTDITIANFNSIDTLASYLGATSPVVSA
jgi:acyl carrier protein